MEGLKFADVNSSISYYIATCISFSNFHIESCSRDESTINAPFHGLTDERHMLPVLRYLPDLSSIFETSRHIAEIENESRERCMGGCVLAVGVWIVHKISKRLPLIRSLQCPVDVYFALDSPLSSSLSNVCGSKCRARWFVPHHLLVTQLFYQRVFA